MSLDDYRNRRDFRETEEPEGGSEDGNGSGGSGRPRFVVQEHDASSRHWDLRLEVEGVLKSWAVPKGPSTDPAEKRLALRTEDHPLEYADFEGVIPEDEYGGGSVIVWDRGSYRNLKEDDDGDELPLSDQVRDGHLTVWLEGEKLRGGWALTRMGDDDDDDEKWLLVKMDDEEADARRNPTSTEPESVVSGRTVEEVAEEVDEDGGDDRDERE